MMVGRLAYVCGCVCVFTHVFGNLNKMILEPPATKCLLVFSVFYHSKSPVFISNPFLLLNELEEHVPAK